MKGTIKRGKKPARLLCVVAGAMAVAIARTVAMVAAVSVSGAIALLLSKYPSMSPRETKIRLKNSSTDLSLPHTRQGWGYLNIPSLLSTF